METNEEVQKIMDEIAKQDSPVGFDALRTHAMILFQLKKISERLDHLEQNIKK